MRELPSDLELRVRRLWDGDDRGFRYRVAPSLPVARRAFFDVFDRVWRGSTSKDRRPPDGWTVYLDETRILSDKLKLRDHLEQLWIAGRSREITVVASTQAPRFVPTEFYDQPRYIAFGRIRDKQALRRFGEIGGDSDMITDVVPRLDWHEFLIIGPEDWAVRTRIPGKSTR